MSTSRHKSSSLPDNKSQSRNRHAPPQQHQQPQSPHSTHSRPYHHGSPSGSTASHKSSVPHKHAPSPLKMVTTPSAHSYQSGSSYYYLPEMNVKESDLQSQGWMAPTVIEDEDLMFGGKSLSTWYEEEQRQQASYESEEEHRGRQRVRAHHSHSHHDHHKHHKSSYSSKGSDQKKH